MKLKFLLLILLMTCCVSVAAQHKAKTIKLKAILWENENKLELKLAQREELDFYTFAIELGWALEADPAIQKVEVTDPKAGYLQKIVIIYRRDKILDPYELEKPDMAAELFEFLDNRWRHIIEAKTERKVKWDGGRIRLPDK